MESRPQETGGQVFQPSFPTLRPGPRPNRGAPAKLNSECASARSRCAPTLPGWLTAIEPGKQSFLAPTLTSLAAHQRHPGLHELLRYVQSPGDSVACNS